MEQNMEDTLTLARQERERQGPWEIEISYGGEADLHQHLKSCKKNPGHHKFIPVLQFNMEHLPPDYQDDSLLDYIRVLSDLTVRISPKYISEKRPKTVPGTDKLYPGYHQSPRNIMRVGSGWVLKVTKYPNIYDKKETCTCKECLNSPTPETQFAHITISTATHVVFDELEGKHTTCHLFYDSGNLPRDCSSVITLDETSEVKADVKHDICRITYVTHDTLLIEKLEMLLKKQSRLHEHIRRKFNSNPSLTVIVSHPHGCSKQISVGDYVTLDYVEEYWTEYRYTTATCPGSSGARVFVLGRELWQGDHAHSGGCNDGEHNYSAGGVDSQLSSASRFWDRLAKSRGNRSRNTRITK